MSVRIICSTDAVVNGKMSSEVLNWDQLESNDVIHDDVNDIAFLCTETLTISPR